MGFLSQEDDIKGRQPYKKHLTGRLPQMKTNSQEDDLIRSLPYRKIGKG